MEQHALAKQPKAASYSQPAAAQCKRALPAIWQVGAEHGSALAGLPATFSSHTWAMHSVQSPDPQGELPK